MKIEKVKVCLEIAGKEYFYTGKLIEDNLEYVEIDDVKEGNIRLYKQNIRWIRKLEQNE